MVQVDFPANVSDYMNFKAGRLWAGTIPPPRFSVPNRLVGQLMSLRCFFQVVERFFDYLCGHRCCYLAARITLAEPYIRFAD